MYVFVILSVDWLTSSSEEGVRIGTDISGVAATGTGLSWLSVGIATILPGTAHCVWICSNWLGWDNTMGRPEWNTHSTYTFFKLQVYIMLQSSVRKNTDYCKLWLCADMSIFLNCENYNWSTFMCGVNLSCCFFEEKSFFTFIAYFKTEKVKKIYTEGKIMGSLEMNSVILTHFQWNSATKTILLILLMTLWINDKTI